MKMDFDRFAKFWVPAIIWAIIIFSFSSVSVPVVSPFYWREFVIKKTGHFIEYVIFGSLIYRALLNSGAAKKKAVIYTIIVSLLYAASDEFHQSFIPNREPRVRDVIIDTIGASLAVYFLWRLLPKAPKKLRNWAEKLDLS